MKMVAVGMFLFLLLLGNDAWPQAPTPHDVFGYIIKDGPALGNEKASVTLIEFSDFQCSFCRKFWQDSLPLIREKYIKTGKVRFFYHHFAILGQFSTQAAQAAECAGEKGKFWPYHDKLFSQATSALAFTDSKLKDYAKASGLEPGAFNQCVDSGKYRNKVESETAMSAFLGIRGTPAFFVKQQFLVGAQPFKFFEAAIESELKKAQQTGKPKP